MVQILEDEPSFGQQFARGSGQNIGALLSGMGQGYNQQQEDKIKKLRSDKENEALKRFGLDLSDVTDPEIRKLLVQGTMKSKEADTEKFATGLDILGAMRNIISKKNIGRGSSFLGFFPGETAKDRSEFAQLGKSLIPIVAAGVPIRNQREFDEYKKVITDPSSQLSELQGAIDGLERIFKNKLGQHSFEGEEKTEEARSSPQSNKVKFNPSNPEHKAKATQLYKTYKDKEKVREILRKEFEGI